MERRTNIEFRIKDAEHTMANTFFGGEAFPLFNTEIGPGDLAPFLGCKPVFREDTQVVWYNPVITDPDKNEPFSFDPDNSWWRFHRQIVSDGVKNSRGHYLVGVPDLIEGLDTLAQLRGHNQLVLDLFKRPKWVHARLREITDLYFVYFNAIYDMIRDDVGGNAYSCFSIWGPGRTAKVQCDFSALISPSMFKKFVEPYLREQCNHLDFTLYHLDGPDALCHLDLLLKIPEITAIQWVPGAGKPLPESPTWFPIYKKILKAGKSLWLNIPINLIKKFVKIFGEKGLFIITNAKSEKEARDLLENT